MCTDLRPRLFIPRRTAPLVPSNFFSKFRFWPISKAKCSSPNGDGQDAHYGLASLSHRHGESKKKGSQNVHPGPKMRAKINIKIKKTRTCAAVVALIASKKTRTPSSSLTSAAGFLIASAHPALCFFPPPFTVVKETWQPVLPVYTSQKQAKKAHVVLRTLAFKHACSLMSSAHVHISLHHLRVGLPVDPCKPQGW